MRSPFRCALTIVLFAALLVGISGCGSEEVMARPGGAVVDAAGAETRAPVGYPLAVSNESTEPLILLVGAARYDFAPGDRATVRVDPGVTPLRAQFPARYAQDRVSFDEDGVYTLTATRDELRLHKAVGPREHLQTRPFVEGGPPPNLPPPSPTGSASEALRGVQAALGAGDFEAARRQLTALRMQDSGNQLVWLLHARTEAQFGELANATSALGRAQTLGEPAAAWRTTDAQVLERTVLLLHAFQPEAFEHLARTAAPALQTALQQAAAAAKARNYAGALAALQPLQSAMGNDGAFLAALAVAQVVPDPEGARKTAQRAQSRGDRTAHAALAEALLFLKEAAEGDAAKIDAALGAFSRARSINPYNTFAHFGAGIAYWAKGLEPFLLAQAGVLDGLDRTPAEQLPAEALVRPGYGALLRGFITS